ncbi:MAG: tetratricopeptide repeat protein [Chloroflexi bacterium]|nr:tetratricopeptide repeat protein [Chloroflexota bacterium]
MSRDAPGQVSKPLCVYLLGAFRVERGTKTIRFPARKVESLFAFLALHPEPHPREKLSALLWGDSTDEQARHSLRTALASLRKELGDAVLIADRESVQINPGFSMWVDAREISDFRFQISDWTSQQSEILNLKSEIDLLPDFYDDWILPERERLRAIFLDALLQLAQAHREKSDYTRAMEIAQKILAHDPANEKAYQHLIFCLAATGDRIGALKQFDACEKKLRDELGVEPSPETIALRDQIEAALTGAKSREAMFTNVPHPLTSFVGREKEKREIREIMEKARLIALTGAGGCGKTRLAIQVATELANANRFKNGVWWVELAPLSDATLVARTVAAVFNLDEAPNTPMLTTLTNYLRAKDLLLILDNCEHLIDACAQLADALLRACPQLKILASSREALGITGETPYKIPSLSLPPPDFRSFPNFGSLLQSEAVQLFVERAHTLAPTFTLSQSNASAIAQICERLDGIPLALELAAARIKTLSVEQIATRLDDRFRLLTGGSRTALPRQQTLRALIDWSYDLLTETERAVLRRLSVFAGGWTLEAAEAIANPKSQNSNSKTASDQIGDWDLEIGILDMLAHLADKSLVIAEPRADETRYRLMETIRQYARDRLLESGEVETIRDRHLDFFIAFAENIEPKLMGAEQFAWLDRLDSENDNVRAALEWSTSPGRAQKGLQIVGALRLFWDLRAHTNEAYARIQKLLARPEAAEKTLARARALFTLAILAENIESGKAARPYLEETIELARACGASGERQLAMGLAELSLVVRVDQPERAQTLEDESLAIAQALGDEWVSATILHYRGHRCLGEVNRPAARHAFETSMTLFRALGDQHWAMVLYRDIARINFRDGDYATARRQHEEALQFFRAQKDRLSTGSTLIMLGEIARVEQDYPRAKKCYEEALAIAQDLGTALGHQLVLGNLGVTLLRLGDVARARKLLTENLELARQSTRERIISYSLEGMAFVETAEKQFARAARLFGAADSFKPPADSAYSPADAAEREYYFASARAQLDEATFRAAQAEGHMLTLEQAVEYALAQ